MEWNGMEQMKLFISRPDVIPHIDFYVGVALRNRPYPLFTMETPTIQNARYTKYEQRLPCW